MIVYTAQMRYKPRQDDVVIDITVKSANCVYGKLLAPTWDIVMGVKRGDITPALYTEQYLNMLRTRYQRHQKHFIELLQYDQVVLKCYCPAGAFCHRHIAVDVLEKIAAQHNIPFERGGELS